MGEAHPAKGRVAVVAVHGVADQHPGQTVRELARLLCHGGQSTPLYVQGETRGVLLPVPPLRPEDDDALAGPARREGWLPRPGATSRFHAAQVRRHGRAQVEGDLGLAYTDHLLRRYAPAESDTLYESTTIALRRRADGLPVDLFELYWADCSRLRPGGMRALSALYQLFFHLTTLARDLVDQAALVTRGAPGFALLQRLFSWTTWLLKMPAALIQLAMLLLLLFGAAGMLPEGMKPQLLPAAGYALGAACLGLAALAFVRRKAGRGLLDPATGGALLAALASFAFAAYARAHSPETDPARFNALYFSACALGTLGIGALLVERYARLVLDARPVGHAVLLATGALLFLAHPAAFTGELSLSHRMVSAALRAGEWLLVAMLAAWALLLAAQMSGLLLSYRIAARHDAAIRETLCTARLGTIASTGLFALLSLVLWAVLVSVVGLALGETEYEPGVFAAFHPVVVAADFLEARLRSVGALFEPLVLATAVLGLVALYALAPGLREELAPRPARKGEPLAPGAALASERLGRWWQWARRALVGRSAQALPWLAIGGGVLYLVFLLQLAGLRAAGDSEGAGDTLVAIGQWLAGGAVTITALGARFTRTFGKLRVALDAVLDIDNYLRDPADGRSPRAGIFSRAAALLAELRARGYARIVLVSHSQGTVICSDLLHWLAQRGRLDAQVGADTPLALVTLGSPLRDLYARRFPLLYGWMQPVPARFDAADAAPDPRTLGLAQWTNAYRAGDYVGRAIWRADADPELFVPVAVQDGAPAAARAGRRAEFCLGSGAHTHYFDDDALPLALEVDRLVGAPLAPGRREG